MTYPSLREGWGNQFIEAVFAKLPVVLLEYPVWAKVRRQPGALMNECRARGRNAAGAE